MGGLSIWHWLIVLVIVALIFGTKRLGNIGGDVASAIKNFRKALQDEEHPTPPQLKDDETATPGATGTQAKSENKSG